MGRIDKRTVWADGGKRRHEGVGHMLVWRERVGKEGRGIGPLLGTSGREEHGL